MIQVHLIFGSIREPGDQAETHSFATEAEADAFRLGVETASGWLAVYEVSNGSVRVHRDGTLAPDDIVNDWSN